MEEPSRYNFVDPYVEIPREAPYQSGAVWTHWNAHENECRPARCLQQLWKQKLKQLVTGNA